MRRLSDSPSPGEHNVQVKGGDLTMLVHAERGLEVGGVETGSTPPRKADIIHSGRNVPQGSRRALY